MRIVLILAALAVAGWSGYWFVGARGIETGLTTWLDQRGNEGWVAETSGVEVTGFPSRFEATLSDVEVADPGTGVLFSAPDLRIEAASHSPTRATVVFPPEMTIASPRESIAVSTERLTAHFGFVPGPNLTVDDLDAELTALGLASSADWTATVESGTFDLTRKDGTEATYDIVFAADNLTPSDPLRRRIDPARVLPETVEALRLTTTTRFDRPWDRRALEERRPQPTAIDLELLQATWGDLDLRAAGALTIDAEGVPTGQITVKATNWREMVQIAKDAGALPESFAPAVERALEFVAGMSGNPDTIDAPLGFANGTVNFGPIPLGPAPRFYLR